MTVRHVVRGGETRGTVTPTHGHGARNSLVITGRDALLRERDAALAVPTGPDVLTFVCEKKKNTGWYKRTSVTFFAYHSMPKFKTQREQELDGF